jgi:hypothetical protein
MGGLHSCQTIGIETSCVRDQDSGLKPAWANRSRNPVWKTPITTKGWWRGSRCVGPEFKPQYSEKKKKNKKEMKQGYPLFFSCKFLLLCYYCTRSTVTFTKEFTIYFS